MFSVRSGRGSQIFLLKTARSSVKYLRILFVDAQSSQELAKSAGTPAWQECLATKESEYLAGEGTCGPQGFLICLTPGLLRPGVPVLGLHLWKDMFSVLPESCKEFWPVREFLSMRN